MYTSLSLLADVAEVTTAVATSGERWVRLRAIALEVTSKVKRQWSVIVVVVVVVMMQKSYDVSRAQTHV